jgi:hypothetical protein
MITHYVGEVGRDRNASTRNMAPFVSVQAECTWLSLTFSRTKAVPTLEVSMFKRRILFSQAKLSWKRSDSSAKSSGSHVLATSIGDGRQNFPSQEYE